jgi:hypothetical protein
LVAAFNLFYWHFYISPRYRSPDGKSLS